MYLTFKGLKLLLRTGLRKGELCLYLTFKGLKPEHKEDIHPWQESFVSYL